VAARSCRFACAALAAVLWLGSVTSGEEVAGQAAAATSSAPRADGWKPLFDGKTLKDWQITNFGGQGEVYVEDGEIRLERGSPLTGITYLGQTPRCNYELRLEAKRISGHDFFGTVTFPVNDSYCSFVLGGWGGALVGISCIDGHDASENPTTKYLRLESDRWYRVRIQVRPARILVWIDDQQVVELDTTGRKLSTRIEVSLCEPLGISSFETVAGLRGIQWRELPGEEK
jgi:hypothetical protein